MLNRWLCVVSAVSGLLLLPSSGLEGQLWEVGPPGQDIGSISLQMGMLSPTTSFADGSSFDSGFAFGTAVSAWPARRIGVRAKVFRARIEGQHGQVTSPVGFQEPVLWHYNAEISLRHPMLHERVSWFPYVGVGWGGKSYRWSISQPRTGDSGFGWTASGGIELRGGSGSPIGAILDLQYYDTTFHGRRGGPLNDGNFRYFLGIPGGEKQSDFVFSAGITLNR